MNDLETLLSLAEDLARKKSDFARRKGAGRGDLDTSDFMAELEERATEALGDACVPDAPVIEEAGFSFDYLAASCLRASLASCGIFGRDGFSPT